MNRSRKLPARYGAFVTPLILSGLMTLIVSGISTLRVLGPTPAFLAELARCLGPVLADRLPGAAAGPADGAPAHGDAGRAGGVIIAAALLLPPLRGGDEGENRAGKPNAALRPAGRCHSRATNLTWGQ
jgi:hypothetical protein